MRMRVTSVVSVAVLAASGASAQQVFFTDFDSGVPAEFSGAGSAQGVQGYNGLGNSAANSFGGNMLRNDDASNPTQAASVLTLNNLPAHDTLRLDCLVAIIDSWDGFGGVFNDDSFNIKIDGTTVFSQVFASGSGGQTYNPGAPTMLSQGSNLGFSGYNDFALDLSFDANLTVAHSASSVTIEFYASGPGWQGGSDESFGLDNVSVTLRGVPTPGALGLFGAAGLMARRRRA
jgi:hypothetical protein